MTDIETKYQRMLAIAGEIDPRLADAFASSDLSRSYLVVKYKSLTAEALRRIRSSGERVEVSSIEDLVAKFSNEPAKAKRPPGRPKGTKVKRKSLPGLDLDAVFSGGGSDGVNENFIDACRWVVRRIGGDPLPCPSSMARGMLTIAQNDPKALTIYMGFVAKGEEKAMAEARFRDDDRKLIELLQEVRRIHLESVRKSQELVGRHE
jgi:hypothetical protein